MADFATVEDLEAFLQVEIPAEKLEAAQAALKEATAAIRNYCRQHLALVESETITLDGKGGSRIFLPELPVVSVASVVEDGETLTVGDDFRLGQHGILYRIGRSWAVGVQNITITYSHGYSVLPDDITAVCIRAASRAYQAGLRASESEAVPGVASKSLGDFSVSFQSEGGGGIGEGVLGASAARFLLMSEKDLLDRYRI